MLDYDYFKLSQLKNILVNFAEYVNNDSTDDIQKAVSQLSKKDCIKTIDVIIDNTCSLGYQVITDLINNKGKKVKY